MDHPVKKRLRCGLTAVQDAFGPDGRSVGWVAAMLIGAGFRDIQRGTVRVKDVLRLPFCHSNAGRQGGICSLHRKSVAVGRRLPRATAGIENNASRLHGLTGLSWTEPETPHVGRHCCLAVKRINQSKINEVT